MGYGLSRIHELKAELAAMPKVDPATREVSKQEAVRQLAPEIESLQKKGYPLERVVTLLADRGIAITLGTLKTYLSRLRGRRRRQRRADATTTAREQSVSTGGDPRSTPEQTTPATAVGRHVNAGASGAETAGQPTVAAAANSAAQRGERGSGSPPTPAGTPSKASFAPREDSDEI
jgi:hypothetical protein